MLLVPQALQLFMSILEREIARQGKESMFRRMNALARFLPSSLRRLLFRPLHRRLGGKLRFMVSAGAPISPELIHKWELLGVPIIQGYGATECLALTTSTMDDRDPYSVGKPVPGVELKIAADGEVLACRPNVFAGCWRNPEATAAAFVDDWYRTGDLGQLDARGRLRLHGRKKDMTALPNGQKVYVVDVEAALKDVPGVVDAAVVGLPTAQGQQVHAALILGAAAPTPEEIVRRANGKLAPHQYVLSHTIWPDQEFPTTLTLKVKKHELLQRIIDLREEHG